VRSSHIGEMEEQPQSFLSSAQDGGEYLLNKKLPGPRSQSVVLRKDKDFDSAGSKPRIAQPVA
jgi:hypothetical protein